MLIWTVGVVVLALVLWAGTTHFVEGALDQPVYTVVDEVGDVEIRRYEPFIIASTQPDGDGDTGLRSGFRVLAGYIFGGNSPGESMPMTAPVLQQNEPGESLPMTAPVLQTPESMRMAFVMPPDRTLDNLPQPNDSNIVLKEVAWGHVAAIRFSGWATQETFQQHEAELREALDATHRTITGPALYARYNSPYAFPLLRRNEVLIRVAP
jgi:hypothetical protein